MVPVLDGFVFQAVDCLEDLVRVGILSSGGIYNDLAND